MNVYCLGYRQVVWKHVIEYFNVTKGLTEREKKKKKRWGKKACENVTFSYFHPLFFPFIITT